MKAGFRGVAGTQMIVFSLLLLCSVAHGAIGLTNPVDPIPDEVCAQTVATSSPTFSLPAGYALVPAELSGESMRIVNATGFGRGVELFEQDGRLVPTLRGEAELQDARAMLTHAVLARLGKLTEAHRADPRHPIITTTIVPAKFSDPIAQLAVTGRKAFESFRNWHANDLQAPPLQFRGPTVADLVNLTLKDPRAAGVSVADVTTAAHSVLVTAYSTLHAIRDNSAGGRAMRAGMGWIAVSGEDDTPHRPVNVPTAPYPQFDIDVTANGSNGPVTLRTRFMIASWNTFIGPGAPMPGQVVNTVLGGQIFSVFPPPPEFVLPLDIAPTIPAGDKVILYLHGGGSRLEEAVALGNNLILQGHLQQPPVNYKVISLDLPNSAYGDRLDRAAVVPPTYHPSLHHMLDFEEAYVIGFIDALKKQIPNLSIATIMGGSLGGNLTLKLARRDKSVFPYLTDLVPWSVTTLNPGHGDVGNSITWNFTLGTGAESSTTRADYFHDLFYASTDPVFSSLPPQPQMWWRSQWKNANGSVDCAQVHTSESRFDRYEIYSPAMRHWSASLNAEQAMYSFQDKDPGAGLPRLASVTSRILLASGQNDSYGSLNDIFNNTIKAVPEMVNARGQLLLIKNTGHSIHDERPAFFARQIVQFLAPEPAACAGLRNTIASLLAQIAAKQAELAADAKDQADCQSGQGIYRGGSQNKPKDCGASAHQQTNATITAELNKLNGDLRATQNQKAGLHCRE